MRVGEELVMYTLLVADDELFARKGIIKKIQTDPAGISSILEAKDGREGLAIARYTQIDIVLSDVRMPRMDGIEMCRQIRELYPDCVIIFLSGYSDKEYLRSAISMQALQYIDKPVDNQELQDTLRQAVTYCNEIRYSRQFVRKANQKKLARYLLTKPAADGSLPVYMEEAGFGTGDFRDCRTVIFQFLPGPDTAGEKLKVHSILEQSEEVITGALQAGHLRFLLTDYRENNLIVHLMSNAEEKISSFPQEFWEHMLKGISEQLTEFPHFISIGPVVYAAEEIYRSYNCAAINLQNLFYAGANSISFAEEESDMGYCISDESFDAFRQAVHNGDQDGCMQILDELAEGFRTHPGTLVSNTKEDFYRLLSWLIGYIKSKQSAEALETETYLWELLHSAATLDELLDYTRNYLDLFFRTVNGGPENAISQQIKSIIVENYKNPDLDIQFISDRLNLSVSYLSYLFKQETGSTINHYMNSHRIWKAQQLLSGTRMKIADISDAVGYSNQNYFAKTFRKLTGSSPSVYRELNAQDYQSF